MYGSWRWNVYLALLGLIFVFLIGVMNNPWDVALIRGAYAAIVFGLLAFPIRLIVGLVVGNEAPNEENELEQAQVAAAGNNVDYVTPDHEEDLNSLIREQLHNVAGASTENTDTATEEDKANQFEPLRPKKVISTENMEPEDLTKVVRHLTGE